MQYPIEEQAKLREYTINMDVENLIKEFFSDSIDDEIFCRNHQDYYKISGSIVKQQPYVMSIEQQRKEDKIYEMEQKIDERYDRINKKDKITPSKPAFLSNSLGSLDLPEKEKNRRGTLAHSADKLDEIKKQEKKKKTPLAFFKSLSKSPDKKRKKEDLASDTANESTLTPSTTMPSSTTTITSSFKFGKGGD